MIKKEKALEYKLQFPDYLAIAGSRLYGTDTPESDEDTKGFTIAPFEYLAGMSGFEQQVLVQPDQVIFSLQKLFELLLKGDPNALEMLFVPPHQILRCSGVGYHVLDNRDLFLCKKFARRIRGYALSEWRKVRGEQLVPIKRTSTEDSVVEDIRKLFHPKKEDMDEIISLLFKNHTREIRKATGKLGEKRKKQIEKFGFCVSSASHSLRLLEELIELMNTGKITFPRPNAVFLRDIKLGKVSIEEVEDWHTTLSRLAEEAEEKSELPEKPKIKSIHRMYNELIAYAISTDERKRLYFESFLQKSKRFALGIKL
jgi:hypothetical protein